MVMRSAIDVPWQLRAGGRRAGAGQWLDGGVVPAAPRSTQQQAGA